MALHVGELRDDQPQVCADRDLVVEEDPRLDDERVFENYFMSLEQFINTEKEYFCNKFLDSNLKKIFGTQIP